MGASIPCLTRILPQKAEEVHRLHFYIYGINTISAVVGVLLAYLFLIPTVGLIKTSILAASLNFAVGIYCFFTKSLQHSLVSQKPEAEIGSTANKTDEWLVYGIAFLSGLVTLSLELILFRAYGLSIGMNMLVLPIVLAAFLFWLGMGSLSLNWLKATWTNTQLTLTFALLGLAVTYYSIPYWPVWASFILVDREIKRDFDIFLFIVKNLFIFGLVWSIPIFALGRLLPSAFALAKGSTLEPGRKCGDLYAINSIGTIIGSIFCGYVALHYTNIDGVLRFCILLLATGTISLVIFQLKRRPVIVSAITLIFAVFAGGISFTKWDRATHEVGIFRHRDKGVIHEKGLFEIPRASIFKADYFEDGPNTTVSIVKSRVQLKRGLEASFVGTKNHTLLVNGKSDGNTNLDFSTMALASAIPYVYLSANKQDLKSLIIGLGTGISAGYMAKFPKVEAVDVVEISSAVRRGLPIFDPYNFEASKSSKIRIYETDAFRHLKRSPSKYDLIMSEPSTIWVLGVENLFTREYYREIKSKLNDRGVFFQWVHFPGLSRDAFLSIVNNLVQEFPFLQAFQIGHTDIGFVAAMEELQPNADHFNAKFLQEEVFSQLYIPSLDHFKVLQLYDRKYFLQALREADFPEHSLDRPTLNFEAMRGLYLRLTANVNFMVDPLIRRNITYSPEKESALNAILNKPYIGVKECDQEDFGHSYACYRIHILMSQLDELKNIKKIPIPILKLNAYADLRDQGFVKKDLQFLEAVAEVTEGKRGIQALVRELSRDGEYRIAKKVIRVALESGFIDEKLQARLFEAVQTSIDRQLATDQEQN